MLESVKSREGSSSHEECEVVEVHMPSSRREDDEDEDEDESKTGMAEREEHKEDMIATSQLA